MLLTTDGVVVSVTTALAALPVAATAQSNRKTSNGQSRPANRRRDPPGHTTGAVAGKGKFIQRCSGHFKQLHHNILLTEN
jgi:hypothetical protein